MQTRIGALALGRLLGDGWQGAGPTYSALAARLRSLVLDGRLPLEVRVPSERQLATQLGVSRTTVTAAFDALREEGFLRSRQGSGSWTAVPGGVRPTGGAISPPPPDDSLHDVVDLAAATLPADGVAVRAAYEAALLALPRHLPGSGYEAGGLAVTRRAVADDLTRRGLPTTPDQVVVTSGAVSAWALLLRVLTTPGDRVVVEQPTYPNALEAARRAGARLVPVPLGGCDEPLWDVDAWRATLRQAAPRLGYVIPDCQNPTGGVMDDATRRALVAAADAAGTVLVSDETLVDLRSEGPAPRPLAAFSDSVVTVGGLSKSAWAGLRLGWVRAPRDLVDRLVEARLSWDLGTPVVEQLALAHVLADPDRPRHLAGRRALVAARRDALETALRRHLPQWRWRAPQGGLSVWVALADRSSTSMAERAAAHGLRLAAGPRFGVDGALERYLRLPFVVPVERVDDTVRRLAALAAEAPSSRPSRLVV
ncbi:PLP-dependent aminotransferase family protein [Aquipuribacter nitratireducens]|uniref:PLP-dependent aminotransferase family protein n=1 Tax=Aquipuribacter nitratireducens TaxID=650104 RepID=A0ABW0GS91_9MICO